MTNSDNFLSSLSDDEIQDLLERADYKDGVQYPFPHYDTRPFPRLLDFQAFIQRTHGDGLDFQADLYYTGYDYHPPKTPKTPLFIPDDDK